MTILIALAFVVIVVMVYALWGRAWLKTKPWATGFFSFFEPIEIVFWRKSETILFARFKMLVGLLLTLLTQLGTIDLTPLMPFVPDQYEPLLRMVFNALPLVLTVLGMMDEKLRGDTTKPLELVAITDKDVEADPKLAAIVAVADATKFEAVAAVEEAKAEGKV